MSFNSANINVPKVTQTALLTGVKSAHLADSSFAVQLSGVMEYMAANNCDFHTAASVFAAQHREIQDPPEVVLQAETEAEARTRLSTEFGLLCEVQKNTDMAHKALFELYHAREVTSETVSNQEQELLRLSTAHGEDPTHPALIAIAEALAMSKVQLELSSSSIAAAREQYSSLRTKNADMTALWETHLSQFSRQFACDFHSDIDSGSSVLQKRPQSPLGIDQSSKQSAAAFDEAIDLDSAKRFKSVS